MKPGFLAINWTAISAMAWLVAVTGCGAKHAGGDAADLPAVTVQTLMVAPKTRAATEEEIGTVRPRLSAVLEAKVNGSIEKMLAIPGQPVKAGDLLVKLDANEIQARYDQATASLTEAEQDWKRASTLFEQESASRAEYDAANARYRVAQGAMAEARTMISYVEIRAPFDGVVTRKMADVGDLAAPGKPLIEMEDPAHLRLESDVPETLVHNIKAGDRLSVRVDALETNFAGEVSEIAPSADPNSHTFVVKLDLPQAPGLRSGQFGRVAVPSGEVSALRVPALAVIQRGDMELLFVATGGHAQLRIVKTGARVGDEFEIVSGLDPGEQVIVSHPNNLLDGQPVVAKP